MMSKKKTIIVLLVLFTLFALIFVFAKVITKDNVRGYIVTGNVASFFCDNLNCHSVKKSVFKDLEEDKRVFNLYYKTDYLGDCYAVYEDRWNFFDANNKWQSIPSDFIAFSPSLNASVLNYKSRKFNKDEEEKLKEILKKQGFNHDYTALDTSVYEITTESGEILEFFFATNNVIDEIGQYYFTIVYTNISNTINIVEYNESTKPDGMPNFHLYNVFHFKNKEEIGVFINTNYPSLVGKPSMTLYKLRKNKLEKIIEVAKEEES